MDSADCSAARRYRAQARQDRRKIAACTRKGYPMKRSFLARLQRAALFSLIGALMLLLVVPILQLLVLGPQGYGTALTSPQASLLWIQEHTLLFLLYRLALWWALPCCSVCRSRSFASLLPR